MPFAPTTDYESFPSNEYDKIVGSILASAALSTSGVFLELLIIATNLTTPSLWADHGGRHLSKALSYRWTRM